MPILYYRDPADGTFKPLVSPPVAGVAGPHNDLTGREVAGAHPIAAVTGLQAELDAKATTSELAGKANSSHTHSQYPVVTVSGSAPTNPNLGDIWCPT